MVPDELSGGPYFAAFCERYLRHTKGRWSGRPLVFEDWQREFWWEALEVDCATGLRVYSEIGLGLPRKNGKLAPVGVGGRVEVPGHGFALTLPPGWVWVRQSPLDAAGFADTLEAVMDPGDAIRVAPRQCGLGQAHQNLG